MLVGQPPHEQRVFAYVHFLRSGAKSGGVTQNKDMEEVIEEFVNVTVKMDIDSVDQFSPDKVWSLLFNPELFEESSGAGPTRSKASKNTDDTWMAGVMEENADSWLGKLAEKNQTASDASARSDDDDDFADEQTHKSYPSEPKLDLARGDSDIDATPGRKSGTGFRQGERVNVYSTHAEKWFEDGIIMVKLKSAGRLEGFDLKAGSLKVQFGEGKRFKWLAPDMLHVLKKTSRPEPPAQVVGELYKKTNHCFASWHVRYVEVRLGFLQWWANQDEVKADLEAKAIVHLHGMDISVVGTVLHVKTSSMGKRTYSFDATTDEACEEWRTHLIKHADYCTAMRKYLKSEEHELLKINLPPTPADQQ